MKPELFLLFTLGASSTSACAWYFFCHCYNSDGLFNNTATATVCGWYGSGLVYATFIYGVTTGNEECFGAGMALNNCKWREHCQQVGATGDDSSCWCKDDCNPPNQSPVPTGVAAGP